ncbi:MAG: hypothetical protein ACW99A_11385 [Candidatus Kariarchaeaceae archaeon]|jgi:hypothetical protein
MFIKNTLFKLAIFMTLILLTSSSTTLSISAQSSENTIYSAEAVVKPTIDGILADGEWGENPTLDSWLNYTKTTGGSESHQFKVYVQNDNVNLYIAILLMNEDFNTTDSYDKMALYFDSNNNGILDGTEDLKVFQSLEYTDWYYHEDGYTTVDGESNGRGKATHTTQGDNGDYIYEFEFRLNSGDTKDIAVSAGDTLGILIDYTEFSGSVNTGSYGVGSDVWPSDSFTPSEFDSYGDLVLIESTVVPGTNDITTSGQETTISTTSGTTKVVSTVSTDDKSDNGFVSYLIYPLFFALFLILHRKRI